jgi:hypothetical protein
MAAEYEAAIAAASRNHAMAAETQLGASTNLCVAYTLTREFEQALAPCNKAVSMAGAFRHTVLLSSASREVLAKALSNRGVLRALSNDTAGASADFEKATAMQRSWAAANANLTRLKDMPSYSAAVARASSN